MELLSKVKINKKGGIWQFHNLYDPCLLRFMNKTLLKLSLPIMTFMPQIVCANEIFGEDYDEFRRAADESKNVWASLSGDASGFVKGIQEIFGFGMGLLGLAYSIGIAIDIFVLVYSIIKYGISGKAPKAREEAKHDIMISLIILAIFGGIPIIYALIIQILNLI